MCLACGEPPEHIRNRNPHMANARTTAPLTRLYGNDALVVHGRKPSIITCSVQQRFAGLGLACRGTAEGYDKLPLGDNLGLPFVGTMTIFWPSARTRGR
jgi:hypothetical protein